MFSSRKEYKDLAGSPYQLRRRLASVETMENRQTIDQEIFACKTQHFLGTARVPIGKLEFPQVPSLCREMNEKNVARLLHIFKLEGCLRLEAENHVSAIIDPALSTNAVLKSGLDVNTLSKSSEPRLLPNPDFNVACLNGRHRVAAARRFLDPYDDWWTVDFYDNSMF